MRCEKCRERNATYHITTIVSGQPGSATTLNFCAVCARAAGVDDVSAPFDHPSIPSIENVAGKLPELDGVALYLKQMEKIPPLSTRQKHALFRRFKGKHAENRGKAAVKIAEAHLRLVIAIAKKYPKEGMSFLDTVQTGNLALLSAMKRFDPKEDGRFDDFASPLIQHAISRATKRRSR
jgi:DNA-directed RNA polymerase sigma subunit (sigma70/sigma32)